MREHTISFSQKVPDLIIFDSGYGQHCIPVYKSGIPFIFFESMVAQHQRKAVPICESKTKYGSSLLANLSWRRYYLYRSIRGRVFSFLYGFKDFKKVVMNTAAIHNFPKKYIESIYYF